jgi:hypothetical protein
MTNEFDDGTLHGVGLILKLIKEGLITTLKESGLDSEIYKQMLLVAENVIDFYDRCEKAHKSGCLHLFRPRTAQEKEEKLH